MKGPDALLATLDSRGRGHKRGRHEGEPTAAATASVH